ncbi:MAG: nucleotide-binding protein [Rikenellaceae bacterium]
MKNIYNRYDDMGYFNNPLKLKDGVSQERASGVFERLQKFGRDLLGKDDRMGFTQWLLNINEEFKRIMEDNASLSKCINELLAVNKSMLATSPGVSYFQGGLYGGITSIDNEINTALDILTDMRSKVLVEVVAVSPKESAKKEIKQEKQQCSNKAFIVHGHDGEMKEVVARFVEKLGLEAIILHEQPNKGRTIIEKFEGCSDVAFAIVLLSPDDLGNSKDDIVTLNQRARQNVILELGYFMGKLGRNKVCAIVKDSVERPSDIDGVVYISYDGSWRLEVAKEMKAAGLAIDMNNAV